MFRFHRRPRLPTVYRLPHIFTAGNRFNYQPQTGINGESNFIGAAIPALGPGSEAQRQKFNNYLNSDQGREMGVMAEEVKFYGAIADLARANPDFRKAYDADPDAAIDRYYNERADTMSAIRMPRVQTVPDNWRQLAGHHGGQAR